MANIRRIKNLKISETPDKVKNDWAEVKSFRNRLLQNSDWIFVPDNNLEADIIIAWKQWRHSVRTVNDFDDRKRAIDFLQNLQDNEPPVKYRSSKFGSLELYKDELKEMLRKIMVTVTNGIYESGHTKEIYEERFREATRHQSGILSNNYLIELEMKYSEYTADQIAIKFMEEFNNYIKRLVIIENVSKKYLWKIEKLETIQECDKLSNELIILGSKKWI